MEEGYRKIKGFGRLTFRNERKDMTNQSLNAMRMVLLVLIVLLLCLTAYLYFKTGQLNFGSLVGALGCLAVLLITGRKGANGKQ
jgi:uncharacterized membrane protein affecting hemolysin expression